MKTSLTPEQVREAIREAIQKKFSDLLREVRESRGSLSSLASQIGVSRRALDFYAGIPQEKLPAKEKKRKGSVPEADVLLMAFVQWDWTVRIEGLGGTPDWCEFSVSDVEGGVERKKKMVPAVQLSLFGALTELNEDIGSLKKTVVRVES